MMKLTKEKDNEQQEGITLGMVSFFLRRFLQKKQKEICAWHCVIAEGVNLILWVTSFFRYGRSLEAGFAGCLLSALLVLSIVDWKTREIPREINLFVLLLAVWHTVLHAEQRLTYILGFFCISLVLSVTYRITRGRGIGGGDIKLMAAIGMFLGWEQSLWAFLAAGICACVVQSGRILIGKSRRVFAFGPYLSVGILAVLWFAEWVVL